ncbi:MAG TPA: zinc ribbon domain-containing protein [Candidatus Bathyarchaeia archaeon]|nr:zinc ribbon domain-containing protein [Candidatus Bathyarchaeia archaeon]
MSEQSFCMECGNTLENGSVFCNKCGTKAGTFSNQIIPPKEEEITITPDYSMQQPENPPTFGYDNSDVFATPVALGDQTQAPKKIKNPVALAAVIIDVLGMLFFIMNDSVGQWLAFGLGITGIVVAIISFFFKKDRPLSVVGTILGVVVIVAWASIVYNWPF